MYMAAFLMADTWLTEVSLNSLRRYEQECINAKATNGINTIDALNVSLDTNT